MKATQHNNVLVVRRDEKCLRESTNVHADTAIIVIFTVQRTFWQKHFTVKSENLILALKTQSIYGSLSGWKQQMVCSDPVKRKSDCCQIQLMKQTPVTSHKKNVSTAFFVGAFSSICLEPPTSKTVCFKWGRFIGKGVYR